MFTNKYYNKYYNIYTIEDLKWNILISQVSDTSNDLK